MLRPALPLPPTPQQSVGLRCVPLLQPSQLKQAGCYHGKNTLGVVAKGSEDGGQCGAWRAGVADQNQGDGEHEAQTEWAWIVSACLMTSCRLDTTCKAQTMQGRSMLSTSGCTTPGKVGVDTCWASGLPLLQVLACTSLNCSVAPAGLGACCHTCQIPRPAGSSQVWQQGRKPAGATPQLRLAARDHARRLQPTGACMWKPPQCPGG